ncbi:spore cortex biosynthesis protein YabQ [Anaerofustis butyriciformans]|uniref:spore cortex biosynthesis protein YabQ n=1 Tax=Anaerofustis TaxID=264995 RepID=UPI003F886BAF
MTDTIYSQYLILFETFYGGFILGVMYHTITIIVYAITKKINLSDLCFCLVGAVFTIDLFFKTTYFDLRYYSILSFILGFVAYYFIISPIYKKFLFFITSKIGLTNKKIKRKINIKKNKIKKKYKGPIIKIKTLLKHILSIPIKIKISYNNFKIYKKEGIGINEKRKLFFTKYQQQHRCKKKNSKKEKKTCR